MSSVVEIIKEKSALPAHIIPITVYVKSLEFAKELEDVLLWPHLESQPTSVIGVVISPSTEYHHLPVVYLPAMCGEVGIDIDYVVRGIRKR